MNFHELLTEFGLGHLKDIDIFGKKVNSTIDYDNTENEAEKANEIIGRVLEEDQMFLFQIMDTKEWLST